MCPCLLFPCLARASFLSLLTSHSLAGLSRPPGVRATPLHPLSSCPASFGSLGPSAGPAPSWLRDLVHVSEPDAFRILICKSGPENGALPTPTHSVFSRCWS